MAKVKLDLDPKPAGFTFKRAVSIPTESGKVLKITFDMLYRDREEIAELVSANFEEARRKYNEIRDEVEASSADAQKMKSGRELAREGLVRDVEQLRAIATGWDADADWADDAILTAFLKRYAGAASAIWNDYKTTLTEGRLGN